MTTEPSNGTASDDQRCYIERLEAIEKAVRAIIEQGLDLEYFNSTDKWFCEYCEGGMVEVYDKFVHESDCPLDALRAALEANR